MADETSYVARPRASVWESLSDKHDQARKRMEELLAAFKERDGARVLSIVGPYGSGKSELMAWGFRYAWKDLGLPAVYVNLETLLDALPPSLSPKTLVEEIGRFVTAQLEQVAANLEAKPRPAGVYLATDVKPGESLLEYLRDLFAIPDLAADTVRACVAGAKPVLFLDEIEQKYAELTKRVLADDRAPFREVFQSVEQGLAGYYLVGSFGLTSAYESVSDADTRRQETVQLPIPEPQRLLLPPDSEPYRNFFWWASRGRPGWARKLAAEWGQQLIGIEEFEQFGRLDPRMIDSLPIVDVNAHQQLLSNSRAGSMFTALLKTLKPYRVNDLPGYQSPEENLAALLGDHWITVAGEDGRVTVNAFCDSFLGDLRAFGLQSGLTVRGFHHLSSYLRLIVRAMADEDETLVLGAWRVDTEIVVRAVIVPLLQTLRDLLLEFEGDTEEISELLALIDKVFAQGQVRGEHIDALHVLENIFDKTIEPLISVRRPREVREVALSPFAIDNLFPRMVGRPLLLLHPQARGSIGEQGAAVDADATGRSWFLSTTLQYDNVKVRVFFVPGKQALERLQERLFNRNQRNVYVVADAVTVLVPLSDGLSLGDLNRERNSDDLAVLREMQMVQLHQLDERRTRDFLISLWENLRLMGRANSDADLQVLLDNLYDEPGLSKSQRRQIDYYRTRLRQKFGQLGPTAAVAYRSARSQIFDPQDERLLTRLSAILNAIRPTRTVELVAVAFDVARDQQRSLEVLYGLRQLERLIDLLTNPHGYKEFLSNAAVRAKGADVRSGSLLNEIVEHIQTNGYFNELLGVATNLGFAFGTHWAEMTESTDSAPILQLFGKLDEPRSVFLRGASFQAFLTQNQAALQEQIAREAQQCAQLNPLLEQLIEQSRQFNQQLGRPILSMARIEQYRQELSSLHALLTASNAFPPAVQYVLFRFAQAARAKLDEERQRWKGEKGLEGWRSAFRPALDILARRDSLGAEVELLYEQDAELKARLLGDPEQVASRLQQLLNKAIDALFAGLDQTYESEAKIPDFDTGPLMQARNQVERELERLQAEANKIDQLASQLTEVHDRLSQIFERMQVSQ